MNQVEIMLFPKTVIFARLESSSIRLSSPSGRFSFPDNPYHGPVPAENVY